jgi:hypothetical protein
MKLYAPVDKAGLALASLRVVWALTARISFHNLRFYKRWTRSLQL